MAKKGLWNIAKKRMLEDRNLLQEYQAMHEENFSAVGCGRMWRAQKKKGRG